MVSILIKYSLSAEFISNDDEIAELFNYEKMEGEISKEIKKLYSDAEIEFESIQGHVKPQKMFEVFCEEDEVSVDVILICDELDFSEEKFYDFLEYNHVEKFIKKVGQSGNSLSIHLPKISEDFGFDKGTEVEIKLLTNRIIITPQLKKEYYSRIQGFYRDVRVIRPKWNDSNMSARFEELHSDTVQSPYDASAYDIRLYFDHKTTKHFFFYCSNGFNDQWWGNYCTESEMEQMRSGKTPQSLGY